MKRRQLEPCDPTGYYDSPRAPVRAFGFDLINPALRKSGLRACISSRITTVIHVVKKPSSKQ